jgi:DNA invertase Pin-like site-specific DNA recombinase
LHPTIIAGLARNAERATDLAYRFAVQQLSDKPQTLLPLRLQISAALAENERDVIRERTIAGLASARARGRKGGRPAKLTPKQVCTARKMLADPEMTIKEVAEAFDVNRATIYRSLGLGLRAARILCRE